jgi:hypothetical protein
MNTLRDWTGLATLALAALSCLFSVLGLVLAVNGGAPAVTMAAHAAPARAAPAEDLPRVLVAVEIVMPHLPRPAPFPRSFATAVALAAGDAEATALLLPLAAAAAEGAPTLRQLAESFAPAADAAVLAEMGLASDGWIVRRAAATMRLGAGIGAAGTPGLAALRDAEARLAAGDAPGAEAALGQLGVATAAALAPWRGGLQRRIAVDAAQARLDALALARAAAR